MSIDAPLLARVLEGAGRAARRIARPYSPTDGISLK